MTATTLALAADIIPLPVDSDGDDDLVHCVCDYCSRALCDGGVCGIPVEDPNPAEECVVCIDLEPRFLDVCPYCQSGEAS